MTEADQTTSELPSSQEAPLNRSEKLKQAITVIMISGADYGTGSSTLAKILSESLEINLNTQPGKIRRGFAWAWHNFKIKTKEKNRIFNTEELTEDAQLAQQWHVFRQGILYLYEEAIIGKPEKLLEYIQKLIAKYPQTGESGSEEDFLKEFNDDQAKFEKYVEEKDHPNFWVMIPDLVAAAELNKPTDKAGYVVEGKLAIALDKILDLMPSTALNLIRIVLKVSEEESARRVFQREIEKDQVEVPKEFPHEKWPTYEDWYQDKLNEYQSYNNERRQSDKSDYETVYGIDKNMLAQYQEAEGVHVIDTTELSINEVLRQVLEIIILEAPALAPAAIAALEGLAEND